jgi:hypothetical protein
MLKRFWNWIRRLKPEGTPAVVSSEIVGLLACKIGKHKWRRIRVTHYNRWSGDICERCGLSRSTFQRLYGQFDDVKRSPDDFVRVAGGNKPMPYDKQPNDES